MNARFERYLHDVTWRFWSNGLQMIKLIEMAQIEHYHVPTSLASLILKFVLGCKSDYSCILTVVSATAVIWQVCFLLFNTNTDTYYSYINKIRATVLYKKKYQTFGKFMVLSDQKSFLGSHRARLKQKKTNVHAYKFSDLCWLFFEN